MAVTAYLAAAGYETELRDELERAGLGRSLRRAHGELFISDAPPVEAVWALNTWLDAEELPVDSVADAAAQLRDRQRNWVAYAPLHRGRAGLIASRLPHVSGRELLLGEDAPRAPLGSFTLLRDDLVLAASRCTSPFPNGQPALRRIPHGPPSRAYLKLWEALLILRRWPGERCLDLGASPGGWTWLLSEIGAHVVAVDRAPLDPAVAARPNVRWQRGDAFALDPATLQSAERFDWVLSDVACYPERLLPLAQQWLATTPTPSLLFTVKFRGPTDHASVEALRALPGARCFHLWHNKHELTFALPAARPADALSC